MSNERQSGLLDSLANLIRAVTWFLVVTIILASMGWVLVGRSRRDDRADGKRPRAKSIPKPVDWSAVDAAIADSLRHAREAAEIHASKELDAWVAGLMKKVDEYMAKKKPAKSSDEDAAERERQIAEEAAEAERQRIADIDATKSSSRNGASSDEESDEYKKQLDLAKRAGISKERLDKSLARRKKIPGLG